ncbi:hypothetical protein V513_03835 [Mesotoga sp. H07.pep.5.3]|nr:hypothetical protein V513_03835 [Mesotoga sp. H07.pep.5.3]
MSGWHKRLKEDRFEKGMALIIGLAKNAGFLFLQLASRKLQRCSFGRTAVRPYKKNMILNMITHQEDRYAAPRIVPGA